MNAINLNPFESVSFAVQQQQAKLEQLANTALSRGIDRYMQQDYKGAIKEFKRSIGLAQGSSNAPDAALYMADAHLALDDTKGAEKAYQTALRLNPYRDDIHVKLGNLFFAEERYDEALESYEAAVERNPDATNRFALGQAYMAVGRYSEADTQFNQVRRLAPDRPEGHYGLGLNYSRQGRYEDAIRQFKEAIRQDRRFYDAIAEMGYAHADLGQIDTAMEIVGELEIEAPELADTLSRYAYKVDPPKMVTALPTSRFGFYFPAKTPVALLDPYLQNADAEKTLSMIFQFDKEMDRGSVENVLNWQIRRSTLSGPGQAYNFGRPVADSEVRPAPLPVSVYYDENNFTATVHFNIKQNAAGNGTIDPSHIEFAFSGKDKYGFRMHADFDQFIGFSGVA